MHTHGTAVFGFSDNGRVEAFVRLCGSIKIEYRSTGRVRTFNENEKVRRI